MRKKAKPQVNSNWLKNHLRRKIAGAAILSLAIAGSLYAINRSRQQARQRRKRFLRDWHWFRSCRSHRQFK